MYIFLLDICKIKRMNIRVKFLIMIMIIIIEIFIALFGQLLISKIILFLFL